MNYKKSWPIILIVIFGFFLRFIYLDKYPPSLNWDEVSHGYNAFSILETGKDEWGETLPSIFRAYGDYKLPVYIYTSVISVMIFGLNAISVRLPSVLAGTFLIVFSYLIAKEVFYKKHRKSSSESYKSAPLIVAILAAIEPWGLFLSRAAFEANLALMLFSGGVYFFISGIKKPKRFIVSALMLGLSAWTYNSYRVFMPLMLAVMVFLYRKELASLFKKHSGKIYISLGIAFILFIPMFIQLFSTAGQARFGWVSLIDEGAVSQIVEERQRSDYPSSASRLIYNRPVYFIKNFSANWISHYGPGYLFFRGGDNYQFSIPAHGLIYVVNMPFFIAGFIILVKRSFSRNKAYLLILLWFVFAPVASSLTREAPHVLRSVTMLPTPMIITAMGSAWLLSNVKNRYKYLVCLYLILLFVSLGNYLNHYINVYAKDYSHAWQYGHKEAVDFVAKNYVSYDRVIMTKKYGEPHAFILFFTGWDPVNYRDNPNLIRFHQSNWYWVDRFDKFYFVNDWDIPDVGYEFVLESGGGVRCPVNGVRCLLITSPANVPAGWNKLETIYFLNGRPAFEIYDNSFSDIGLLGY